MLRWISQRSKALIKGRLSVLPQGQVTHCGRCTEHLARGAAVVLDPTNSRQAAGDESFHRRLYLTRAVQQLRHDQRILQCHRAALAHHRGAGVRRVANEHDATAMPSLELKPFNRSAMDRVIARQSGQVVLDKAAEPGEPTAQALQPTMLGICLLYTSPSPRD